MDLVRPLVLDCPRLNVTILAEQLGPSPGGEVLRLIAFLHTIDKAANTVAAYVSAVSTLHNIKSLANPCDNYKVKRAIKGGTSGKSICRY